MLVPTILSKSGTPIIPSWSTATDAEIIDVLDKHYKGKMDLHEYWSVGDERIFEFNIPEDLSVFSSSYKPTFKQYISMVLLNKGGKQLTNNTECAFVVGMKGVLVANKNDTSGSGTDWIASAIMNTTATNIGGWDSCEFRAWANTYFKDALVGNEIFKQFKNISSSGGSNPTTVTSLDYFSLYAEKEMLGTDSSKHKASDVENVLSQFDYYTTTANWAKGVEKTLNELTPADVSADNVMIHLRSADPESTTKFLRWRNIGPAKTFDANVAGGISLFGVI